MKHKSHFMLWVIMMGALIGALLSSWLAPKFISWYFNPPAQFGVSCVAPIEWALSRLRWAQVIGIIGGGILGFIIFYTKIAKDDNNAS